MKRGNTDIGEMEKQVMRVTTEKKLKEGRERVVDDEKAK